MGAAVLLMADTEGELVLQLAVQFIFDGILLSGIFRAVA